MRAAGIGVCALLLGAASSAWEQACPPQFEDCLYSVDPRFADLVSLARQKKFARIIEERANQDVFCDPENWRRRSEMCGVCPYQFEFTAGVPAEYIGVRHCISPYNRKSPVFAEPRVDVEQPGVMDVHNEYNGKEMRVVLPGLAGGSELCNSTAFSSSLSDSIVFIDMTRVRALCNLATRMINVKANGGPMVLSAYPFYSYRTDNMPVSWATVTVDSELDDTLLFSTRTGAKDLDIFALLVAAREAGRADAVRGKVSHRCGEGEPYSNPKADTGQYSGGACPWWFMAQSGDAAALCTSHPNVTRRLCASCPLMLYDPATGEEVGCLHDPDLLPVRARFLMTQSLVYPLRERIVFVDIPALGYRKSGFLCDVANWNMSWRGRIVAAEPPRYSQACSRPDHAIVAHQAGAKAWVSLGRERVHGWSQNVHIPMSATDTRAASDQLTSFFKAKGVQVADNVYEVDVLLDIPAPTTWEVTPAPGVVAEPVLRVEEDGKGVTDDPAGVTGIVLLPVLTVALCVKVYWDSRTGGQLPVQPGLPLGVASTTLSLSLAVLLVIVTYTLLRAAAVEVAEMQRDNKHEALQYMNDREVLTRMQLTEQYLRASVLMIHDKMASVRTDLLSQSRPLRSSVAPVATGRKPGGVVEYETVDYSFWERKVATLRNASLFEDYNPNGMLEVLTYNGYFYSNNWLTHDVLSYVLVNGTKRYINSTNQPFLHSFAVDHSFGREAYRHLSTGRYAIPRAAHDPFKSVSWHQLPPQYTSIVDYHKATYNPVLDERAQLYFSEYQIPAELVSANRYEAAPHEAILTAVFSLIRFEPGASVTHLLPKDSIGVCLLSLSARNLSVALQRSVSREEAELFCTTPQMTCLKYRMNKYKQEIGGLRYQV